MKKVIRETQIMAENQLLKNTPKWGLSGKNN